MNETTFSKALNSNVRVTRQGWNHLISGSKSRRRNIRDKHLRLTLLKPAKFIIKNEPDVTITRNNNIEYATILGVVRNGSKQTKVKVVLKKDKKGKWFFFSVMST